jgi:hypothetical protein
MNVIGYLDFDLLLERLEGGYRARLVSGPAGEGTITFALPFSDLELENFVLRIGRTRQGLRGPETQQIEVVRTFGGKLFSTILTGALKDAFSRSLDIAQQQGKGLRLRLRMMDAPELADIPWEYLYDSSAGRFLALSVESPVVRYLDLPERIRPLTVTPPLRILVMIAAPPGLPDLDVDREWESLNGALADLVARGVVTVDRLQQPTLSALQAVLRREEYHVFHFIGHGAFDTVTQSGVLMLADETGQSQAVAGQDLGALLHDERTLRLVVLNACEGARTSRMDPFAGLAQNLVRQGIPAVIAMQFDITDRASVAFTREFYRALADGYPVDASLAETRKAIFAQGNRVEWGTPVLYMRAPDGRIFDVRARVQPGSPTPILPAVPASPGQHLTDDVAAPPPKLPGSRTRRWLPILIPLVVLVTVVGLYMLFRPKPSTPPPAAPTITSILTPTSAPAIALALATSAPRTADGSFTPVPLYRLGLMTYTGQREGKKTLYVLNNDGTSTPLVESVADLVMLAISPDHRYLAVATSLTTTLSYPSLPVRPSFVTADSLTLWIISADGGKRIPVIPSAHGLSATYTTAGDLVAAVLENSIITYYVARSDGSQLRQLYRSENLFHGGVTPAPATVPTSAPSPIATEGTQP